MDMAEGGKEDIVEEMVGPVLIYMSEFSLIVHVRAARVISGTFPEPFASRLIVLTQQVSGFGPHGLACTCFQRFDGVVGYRICLTHRRSPVRAWLESIFCFFALVTTSKMFCLLISVERTQNGNTGEEMIYFLAYIKLSNLLASLVSVMHQVLKSQKLAKNLLISQ